jgi:hypothetical protein
MEPETAAFGYLRERCIESSGSLSATFGYPRHAPTGERRSHIAQSLAGAFVPFISNRDAMFHPTRNQEATHWSCASPAATRLPSDRNHEMKRDC